MVKMTNFMWSVFYHNKKLRKRDHGIYINSSNMNFGKTMNLHWWQRVYNHGKYSRNLLRVNMQER